MKRFNKIFAVCLTLSVLGGTLLPFPTTCDGFSEPLPIKVEAEGETSTTDTGIGVLITMLLANGIRFVGNFNDTVKPGIEKLWNDFTTATGNQITLATLGAQSVFSLGYLRTSSAVNNAINAFQNWFVSEYSMPVTGDVDIPVGGVSSYITLPTACYSALFRGTNGGYRNYAISAPVRAVILNGSGEETGGGFLYLVSTSSFSTGVSSSSNQAGSSCPAASDIASSITINNILYYCKREQIYSGFSHNPFNIPIIADSNYSSTTYGIYYTYGGGAIADTSITGQTYELKDGFNISNDQAKLIDLAGIESLVGTLGLTLENVNDLIDSIPLIMDYPWAETFPDDPAFADTPDDAIPWVDAPTAVVPAEVPDYVPETPADEGSLKVLGLERVFPFSIPFDFIAVVNLLNAEPVCPEFTFRVFNPISGQNIDTTMSFERFEAVAQVIRIVETIGFIVFLILITRSLIRS